MSLRAWGFLAIAVVVAVGGLFYGYQQYKNRQVDEALQEAVEWARKADESASLARQKDVQIAARTSDLAKAQKDIDQLKLEYAKRRQPRKSVAEFGTAAPVDGLPSEPAGDLALDAADAVISAQDGLIKEQAAQILDLTVSRDSWKGAYEEEHRRAVALQIALDAQKHAAKSGKWVGRLQGFAIGLGAGYVGGKLR